MQSAHTFPVYAYAQPINNNNNTNDRAVVRLVNSWLKRKFKFTFRKSVRRTWAIRIVGSCLHRDHEMVISPNWPANDGASRCKSMDRYREFYHVRINNNKQTNAFMLLWLGQWWNACTYEPYNTRYEMKSKSCENNKNYERNTKAHKGKVYFSRTNHNNKGNENEYFVQIQLLLLDIRRYTRVHCLHLKINNHNI